MIKIYCDSCEKQMHTKNGKESDIYIAVLIKHSQIDNTTQR